VQDIAFRTRPEIVISPPLAGSTAGLTDRDVTTGFSLTATAVVAMVARAPRHAKNAASTTQFNLCGSRWRRSAPIGQIAWHVADRCGRVGRGPDNMSASLHGGAGCSWMRRVDGIDLVNGSYDTHVLRSLPRGYIGSLAVPADDGAVTELAAVGWEPA
jgi:hypothetical protein